MGLTLFWGFLHGVSASVAGLAVAAWWKCSALEPRAGGCLQLELQNRKWMRWRQGREVTAPQREPGSQHLPPHYWQQRCHQRAKFPLPSTGLPLAVEPSMSFEWTRIPTRSHHHQLRGVTAKGSHLNDKDPPNCRQEQASKTMRTMSRWGRGVNSAEAGRQPGEGKWSQTWLHVSQQTWMGSSAITALQSSPPCNAPRTAWYQCSAPRAPSRYLWVPTLALPALPPPALLPAGHPFPLGTW